MKEHAIVSAIAHAQDRMERFHQLDELDRMGWEVYFITVQGPYHYFHIRRDVPVERNFGEIP